MATATGNIVIDGHVYHKNEELPELGSLVCVEAEGGKRSYQGLSADADKLPTYDDLDTGSSAMMLDTGDFYFYHAPTKQWYLQ